MAGPKGRAASAGERVADLPVGPRTGRTPLRYGLVFPGDYRTGMANLGVQTVLGLVSAQPDARCERFFADAPAGVENASALASSDVIALSLSFEGDFQTAARMLAQAGIEPLAARRGPEAPLVIAGGVAPTLNPEPIAPIADLIVLGEAEGLIGPLHDFLRRHRDAPRAALLREARALSPHLYVPSAYEVTYDEDGAIRRSPGAGAPETLTPARAPSGWDPAHTRILAADDAFQGAFLVENSRGCPHGCRFCAIGNLCRPVRFIDPTLLYPYLDMGVRLAGTVGLVGAAVGDHPRFAEIARRVVDQGARLTLSSFRAELMDEEKLSLLIRGGLRTLTVALEAGSEPLRRAMGKRITDEQLLRGATLARDAGLKGLRIYAMVGLPGESREDVEHLMALAARAKKAMGRGTVTLSVAPFVPKPGTPLERAPMMEEKELTARIRLMKSRAHKLPGVTISAESPKWARVQAFLSRGDRRVAEILAADPGGGQWGRLLKSHEEGLSLSGDGTGKRELPWEFVRR